MTRQEFLVTCWTANITAILPATATTADVATAITGLRAIHDIDAATATLISTAVLVARNL